MSQTAHKIDYDQSEQDMVNRHGNVAVHSLNKEELIESELADRYTPGHQLFKPGQSGNPAGRKVGSRNALSEAFIKDIHDKWLQHGSEALDVMLAHEPVKFCQLVAQIIPKDFQVNVTEDRMQWVINAQPGLSTDEWLAAHGLGRSDTQVIEDTSD
jgi:hypothetical protein